MQKIFKDGEDNGSNPLQQWEDLKSQALRVEALDTPHRWNTGSPSLGSWILHVREELRAGGKVNLRSGLPSNVTVLTAENTARVPLDYQLSTPHRRPIDAFERREQSLLVLSPYNETARSFRGFFNRRIPLWEGSSRSALDGLANSLRTGEGNGLAVAEALMKFLGKIGTGFSPFGIRESLDTGGP